MNERSLATINTFDLDVLLKILVQRQLLRPEQAEQAKAGEANARARILKEKVGMDARRRSHYNVSPVEVLVGFRFQDAKGEVLTEDLIVQTLAEATKMRFVKPDPLNLDAELISETMTRPFARRHTCVPLTTEDGKIIIAIDNPFDRALIQELHDVIRQDILVVLSPKSDIQRIITEVYGFRSSIKAAQQHATEGLDLGNLEQLTRLTKVGEIEANDRPIINAVEYLLHYAIEQRASDIHIEPKREHTVIRLRIDGVLHNVQTFPKVVHAPFISRLKMLARMDISEKRRPQDGRIKTARDDSEIELRVASLPVAHGEKIVIRIFDPQALIQSLETIGFYDDDLSIWRSYVNRPTGLVLVTGPTGSGKTTTLYSTLKELAGPDVNITTVEDPIEMVYEEFNQVLVQRRIDVTFVTALRTILRQDPDIIMIGEIRDGETARMATQAALTGHLVISTLHTNDTASTVTRLLDLGVEPFLLSSVLVGVMAQRLVRKICTRCKAQTELTREQMQLLDIQLPPRTNKTLPVAYGEGCISCRQTGYWGRSGVFELLTVDDTIRRLIHHQAAAPEIRKAARANRMMTLRENAIKKLAQGVTTFEEVIAIATEN